MSLLHKFKNHQKNNDQLIWLMAPTIAGILVCTFFLVSMTWAWFSASVDTPTQTIQSATRSTSVTVYELSQPEDENSTVTKTLIKPDIPETLSFDEDTQTTDEDVCVVTAGEELTWELSPEKSYEIIMTGSGTASQGYCKVALSYTASGKDTETKLYKTSAFEKEHTVKFTYNTGGFYDAEGVTATEWNEYVEKTTPPTLTIASYWGEPAEDTTSQVSLMSTRGKEEKEVMLLSDGDVLGLEPIPCPEAKAKTEIELEGFEIQEGAEISAEEDYKVSLTLKEGYEMPSEVVVNIDGKDYVVSTGDAEASEDAPYYDAQAGVLTVPSSLLSDGIKVSVKAAATPIPKEEPEEDATEETTEEATDNNETEENNSADTSSGNNVVADNPTKKEEDGDQSNDEPDKAPAGDGGKDDDDDENDNDSGDPSNDNASSSDNNEEETEDEKADVTLNLSQLTINLEETKIPTNADLVLTLSAKEDMELPERIVISLDKTIRDENIENEEIEEDKTEYTINMNGMKNPEGFEYNVESGELTIASKLLDGVREITITDIKENKIEDVNKKASISFEVKNITFDFTDDNVVTDEDIVITFTASEGYELPETIIITLDGEEYTIYTGKEDGEKNPEGITFDIETGTLTISKDLLKNVKSIAIIAEGVEKEDSDSNSSEEIPDAGNNDELKDNETSDSENESGGIGATDNKTENKPDISASEGKEENKTDNETGVEGGETTAPETNPDNIVEDEDTENTETSDPNADPVTPTTPDAEDNTNSEYDSDNTGSAGNDNDATENETNQTSNTENDDSVETSDPSDVITPQTPNTEISGTSNSAIDSNNNDETDNFDSGLTESNNNGENGTQNNSSSENTTESFPASITHTAPTIDASVINETSESLNTTNSDNNADTEE